MDPIHRFLAGVIVMQVTAFVLGMLFEHYLQKGVSHESED